MSVSVAEAIHPLAGVMQPGRHGTEGGAPLRLDAPSRDVVQVLARRGQDPAVAAALGGLPGPGGSTATAFGTAIWLQPGVWAVLAPRGAEGALAARLRAAAGAMAAVVDQTHGRVVLGIEGAAARFTLAKGIRLDLHDRAFPVGASAVTECAHLGVALLRAGPERYELVVMGTFARELWHWLAEAAAESGYTVR